MDPDEAKNVPKQDPEFPYIKERQKFDREILLKKAMDAGMTREQAQAHVDEHYAGQARSEGQTTAEEATEDLREHGIRNPDYD